MQSLSQKPGGQNQFDVQSLVDSCVHELFEKQVQSTPEQIAITFADLKHNSRLQLTYEELNNKANQLSNFLQDHGVGPDVLVGLCIDRSPEMIIGILGIMKAGGAYVPLDPSYPKERLDFILRDTQASIVLTQKKLFDKISVFNTSVVCLDSDWNKISKYPLKSSSKVEARNLIYVIYTSGSTGTPKGVLIEHRNVVSLIKAQTENFTILGDENILQFSNYAFDASVEQIFLALCNGARLVLMPKELLTQTEDLIELIIKEKITHLHATPSFLQNIPAGNYGQLRRIIAGGESCPANLVKEWCKYTQFYNEYGPTETTVTSIMYRCDGKTMPETTVPIGIPLSNTEVYILDDNLRPIPTGVAGNLYLGGEGVARGYLNREELTAEKFVPNIFSNNTGARLYTTGDIARFLPDGNLEFLGRLDDQVKVRGYRIELGEIESILTQHLEVKSAAVVLREENPGEKHIVAYIVPAVSSDLHQSQMRTFLSKKLPEYMIPSFFVFLQSFPLTTNGKIDRSALPAPVYSRSGVEGYTVAPRDPLEFKLKKIWEDCLNISSIGVQDNFFELGGHSIQAAQMFSKVRKSFGKQLPLATLFQAPTIEKLAYHIREKETVAPWSSLVSIQPNGDRPPLFCMHAGGGTVLFYNSLSAYLGPDQPVYGLQAKGVNGDEAPHTNIEDMASHYITEIRTVQPEGPYYLAGYCLGGILAFEMAQQLIRQHQQIALLASFNGVSPKYIHPPGLPAVQEGDDVQSPESIANKWKDHWKKFMNLDIVEKFFYPFNVLMKRFMTYDQIYKIRKRLYNFYISRDKPLPEALGKIYFLDTNDHMTKAYIPKPYPGRMVIFRSPEIYPDPQLGWNGLVQGGIETCDIPGKHENRRAIMNEPFVQSTADSLKRFLRN